MERKNLRFLVLLLVLISQEMALTRVDARRCESPSQTFRGLCILDRNCALVCQQEGFSGGHCRGFRHRCFCVKDC
uniref:Knottins-like domain-containing protein n=1 Tax=Kalanchoe fedtschenkoi TaxID=63787 RepID=A0A7N0TPG7_KALFE